MVNLKEVLGVINVITDLKTFFSWILMLKRFPKLSTARTTPEAVRKVPAVMGKRNANLPSLGVWETQGWGGGEAPVEWNLWQWVSHNF